jgi:hypothetical protein
MGLVRKARAARRITPNLTFEKEEAAILEAYLACLLENPPAPPSPNDS